MNERQVLVSRIQTPDGTILESRNRHDYNCHIDKNGEYYMIDGGSDYLRTSVNKEPAVNISVYIDSPHEEIREVFTWGTRGVNGDQPLQYKLLKDLTTDHVKNIISHIEDNTFYSESKGKTISVYPLYLKNIFENELLWREE